MSETRKRKSCRNSRSSRNIRSKYRRKTCKHDRVNIKRRRKVYRKSRKTRGGNQVDANCGLPKGITGEYMVGLAKEAKSEEKVDFVLKHLTDLAGYLEKGKSNESACHMIAALACIVLHGMENMTQDNEKKTKIEALKTKLQRLSTHQYYAGGAINKHTRKKTQRGRGPKRKLPKWEFGNGDQFTVDELYGLLEFEHEKREFKNKYKNASEDEQRRFLDGKLYLQQRHNEELQRYRDDTVNWMVEEPGVMPYDARLYHDAPAENPKPKGVVVQPIHYFDLNDTHVPNKLKAEWQRRWVKKNLDINQGIGVKHVDQGFLKKKKQEYDNAFKEFYTTDPEYLAAYEKFVNDTNAKALMNREMRDMAAEEKNQKDVANTIRWREEAKVRSAEALLRHAEEDMIEDPNNPYAFTISWPGVKRRNLEYRESKKVPNTLVATAYDLSTGDKDAYDAIILFDSGDEVAEAYTKFNDKYPQKYIDKARGKTSVLDAIKTATTFIKKSMVDKMGYTKYSSKSQPGKYYVNVGGKTIWILEE